MRCQDGPLNKLGKQWHRIAKSVRNFSALAVTAISRLYSKETMYLACSHFKCFEGLHLSEIQQLPPLVIEKYKLG